MDTSLLGRPIEMRYCCTLASVCPDGLRPAVGTSTDLDLGLRFPLPEEAVLRELSSPQKVKEAALKRAVVTVIEQYVKTWSDQIQEVHDRVL